jgi:hypothetical protein
MGFLVTLASKFFHIQPATAKTKSFISGLMGVLAGLMGIGNAIMNNDANFMDYLQCAVPILIGLGVIFHRDGLTKLAGTISGLTKLLILSLFLQFIPQVQAHDLFNEPFGYLSMPKPAPEVSSDTGNWYLMPLFTQSLLEISRGDDKTFIASPFSGTGLGLSYQRIIIVKGDLYASFALSANLLFAPKIDNGRVPTSGAIVISTLDNWFGIGVRLDGKNVSYVITSTHTIPLPTL